MNKVILLVLCIVPCYLQSLAGSTVRTTQNINRDVLVNGKFLQNADGTYSLSLNTYSDLNTRNFRRNFPVGSYGIYLAFYNKTFVSLQQIKNQYNSYLERVS